MGVACKEGSLGLKAKFVVNLVESLHNSRDLTIDRQDSEHYRMDNTNCLVEFESELNSQTVLYEQIAIEKQVILGLDQCPLLENVEGPRVLQVSGQEVESPQKTDQKANKRKEIETDSIHSAQETKKARTEPSLPSQASSAKRGELSKKYEGGHLAITTSRGASPKALARARAT